MGLKEVQSSSSKNSKLTNNTSQVKENDNIIGYFGKNTYKTNDLWDFLENALSFSELKLWKFESCENTSMFLVFFFPTFNLNTMHIFCHSESSTILVTKKKMHVGNNGNSCVSRSSKWFLDDKLTEIFAGFYYSSTN